MSALKRFLSTIIPVFFLTAFTLVAFGQGLSNDPITWRARAERTSDTTVNAIFEARISGDWHIYSSQLPQGGPMPTLISLDSTAECYPFASLQEEGKLIREHDKIFDMELLMYGDSVRFILPLVVRTKEALSLEAQAEYQTCRSGQCNYFETTIPLALSAIEELPVASNATNAIAPMVSIDVDSTPLEQVEAAKGAESESMWGFLLVSFLAGLAGLLTPCVFPMIPMTVSFFLAKKNRLNAILNAVLFGLSIVAIYTLLGFLVSLTSLGAEFVTDITSHWITNSIFFILFVVFAASFFGMFEIVLPSSLTSKTDAKADKGGFLGSFFFALTTVIVSLSCVGPIVGALLVEAASGASIRPVLGMFAFSLGFSLPFTFFALFPSMLNKLPKSGGWLNSVKIVLGFIVLAFSLKFLLNVDVAFRLGWLTREIFLSLWIVFAVLMGLYLLGFIRFKMDGPLQHVGFLRMLLAAGSFAFALVLLPGLFGAPLPALSGFLPAPSSETRVMVGGAGSVGAVEAYPGLCDAPKYADILSMPAGLEGYRDFEQGLACAKQLGKPALVEFTGHSCANCKEMAAKVLADPAVNAKIRENFVLITLYVDERYELPEAEWYTSTLDGKVKKTIGRQNLDLQQNRFSSSGTPMFVIVSPEGEVLSGPHGRDNDPASFMAFLETGLRQ